MITLLQTAKAQVDIALQEDLQLDFAERLTVQGIAGMSQEERVRQ